MVETYELHREHSDKFAILAFHDASVKTFDELDKKLVDVKARYWGGEDLPFPILLDSTGATIKTFGITAFPTTLLIDPKGMVVGECVASDLMAELPKVPLARRVEMTLDRQVSLELDDSALEEAILDLSWGLPVPVELDNSALKNAGLSASTVVPLTIEGTLSVRSWFELLLDLNGLTYKLVDEAVQIVPGPAVSTRPSGESKPQRRARERIERLFRTRLAFEFKESSLKDVAAELQKKTGENFILDPAARKAGRLDTQAKLSGSDGGKPLGEALENALKAMKLRYVIRSELIVIEPAGVP